MQFDDVLEFLRQKFGENWGNDEEANARFSRDAELVVTEIEGVHLYGGPEVTPDGIVLRVWIDFPVQDLMTADRVAYDVFGRISEDVFYAERHFEERTIRYPFLTGTSLHGHFGALVLDGPHAAEFADRHHQRFSDGTRFHA